MRPAEGSTLEPRIVSASRGRKLVHRHYLTFMAILSLIFLGLNFGDQSMQGIVRYYSEYATIIRLGFSALPGRSLPTFPMWGYGWLIFLFHSKLLILIGQQVLALIAVATAVRAAELSVLTDRGAQILRIGLVLSSPWYALHSVYWPYSIAASLIVISLALLALARESTRPLVLLVISGLCLGVALNFRSDFILFPPVGALVFLWAARDRSRAAWQSVVWLVMVYATLAPWAAYTRKATGHALLTSTNSGQVFFVGLGVLPQNQWGITPDDGDPLLHSIVAARLGPGQSEFSYEANRILMQETTKRVMDAPAEFTRKVGYAAIITILRGFHPGSFFDRASCVPNCYDIYVAQRRALLHFSIPPDRDLLNPARTILEVLMSAWSRVILLACIVALPFTALIGFRQKNLLLALSVLAAAYQFAMSALLNTLPGYTSNVYFFHLLNLVAFITWMLAGRKADCVSGSGGR